MNQTNLYFYFTPTKFETKEVTIPAQGGSIPPSTTTLDNQKLHQKIEKLEEEMGTTCNEENQMTQCLLSFKKSNSSIPLNAKYSKTLFMEDDDENNDT